MLWLAGLALKISIGSQGWLIITVNFVTGNLSLGTENLHGTGSIFRMVSNSVLGPFGLIQIMETLNGIINRK